MSEDHKDISGFFYILQSAEIPDGVYKIGKTKRSSPTKRFCEYPKFSAVKYTVAVSNADDFEKYAMRKFRTVFSRRMEFGLEYYQGDLKQMINLAHELWNKYGDADTIKLNPMLDKIKPVGIQYFINEYWSKQKSKPSIDTAYNKYVELMTKTFQTRDYAAKNVFELYINTILNS